MQSPRLVSVSDNGSKYPHLAASSGPSSSYSNCLSTMHPTLADSFNEPSLRSVHHSLAKLTRFSDQCPLEVRFPADLCLRSSPGGGGAGLSKPFTISYPRGPRMFDKDETTIIDVFSPKMSSFELSPASSASSELDGDGSRLSFDAFIATRSRVVRLLNLPHSPTTFLSQTFAALNVQPITLWCLRDAYVGERPKEDGIWAVFRKHEEACAALSLSGPSMSVVTAVETDLEPFHKLQRFPLDVSIGAASRPPALSPAAHNIAMVRLAPSSECQSTVAVTRSSKDVGEFTLSSNPPNPRVNFRLGDWICSSMNCAAHNFGRNLACIGCGCPRSGNGGIAPRYQASASPARGLASPRFVGSAGFVTSFGKSGDTSSIPTSSLSAAPYLHQHQMSPPPAMINKASSQSHPLLTPSGRAFAIGGKVQNISSDPLSPCVMYWPENEPLPEQGQIRPNTLAGIPQPPILNTGNRGPIEHQPGDWICLKCNYLNWRRRKVCQTCYPYAEGNGDSISSAVQAERIALLTSVLAQSQALASAPHPNTLPQSQSRSLSITTPGIQSHSADSYGLKNTVLSHRPRPQLEPSDYTHSQPIYQTSGHRPRTPSPNTIGTLQLHAPAPLLPSFLQDIVQSPAVSPTSTSSADLSLDELEGRHLSPLRHCQHTSSSETDKRPPSNMALRNIWRMDGEETKTLSASAFGLSNQEMRIPHATR